jgi:biopolymer transport protein ExbD
MRRLRPRRPAPPPTIGGLAPLVDVVTLLLLVLLRAWSSDPPLDLPPNELTLATGATAQDAPRIATIDLGQDGIFLDGVRVASTRWYLDHPDDLIDELRGPLLQRGLDKVALRPDAHLPYRLVRKALIAIREADIREVVIVAADRGGL